LKNLKLRVFSDLPRYDQETKKFLPPGPEAMMLEKFLKNTQKSKYHKSLNHMLELSKEYGIEKVTINIYLYK
jgi:hypothetical protein